MPSEVSLSFKGDTLLLEGVLDFTNVVSLYQKGNQWLQTEAPEHCKIDFGGINRCNSAATTLLLSWLRTAKKSGKHVSIEKIPTEFRSLMTLGGLESLLPQS
ncbi:STAS domain-containing protein [Aestuariicella sp. G3-2]|uniref:STAS domain-containing protein n=1 Tax=Pseudomaricurvus albidus TaxID=2842452 RepID=UPI001C0B267A|nr:STAS domain-containing protein [Aestuariicella albida]MBU3071278.1 STAS domain-containing protein [Aestuariicella albida]